MTQNQFTLYIFSSITNEYKQLDIDNNSDMLTVFSVENIQDVSTRKDNITKDLTLKGTKNNNINLGNLYDISRYSSDTYASDLQHNFVPNQQIRCVLLENNVQVMGGNLVIRNIQINNDVITYECAIIGSLVSFFGKIKDQSLDKVDYGNTLYNWNMSTIRSSWVGNTDVCYPSIDYGIDERVGDNINNWDSSYDLKNYRPAIKLTKYLDSIFHGYTLDTSKINHIIKDVIIPMNEERWMRELEGIWTRITLNDYTSTDTSLFRAMAVGNSTQPANRYYYTYDPKYFGANRYTNFYPMEGNTLNTPNIPSFRPLDKNNKSGITITYNLTINANQPGTYTTGLCDISAKKHIDKTNMVHSHTITKTDSIARTYPIVIEVPDDVSLGGEYVVALIKEGGQPGLSFSVSNFKMEFGKVGSKSKVEQDFGDQFYIKDVVPKDVKVMEFLKSVMTLFNLYLISDPADDNKFILDTYNNYYRDTINLNRAVATDWTSKIDFTNYSISTNINLPKSYLYKFSEDSDMLSDKYKNTWNEVYGQYSVNDSKGTAAQKEQTLVFAPSINIQHSQDEKSMPVLYKADGFLTGKKKPFKSKIRIMYLVGRVYPKQPYQITWRGRDYIQETQYGYASMINTNTNNTLLFDLPREYYTQEDIQRDDTTTLYNKYHSQQITDLTDDNLIIFQAKTYLTEIDISNLDLSKPIYLQSQYGNSYFKILEVEYTNAYTPANIKLQKIVVK